MSVRVRGETVARLVVGWQEKGSGPAELRLAAALTTLVLDGVIVGQTRLPSERELAAHLRVSRAAVAGAYARLRDRGLLVSRPGAGSWTASHLQRRAGSLVPISDSGRGFVDLAIATAQPDRDIMTDAFSAAMTMLGTELADRGGTPGYHSCGIPALREAVAARYRERGVPTTADQIFISLGAQGAIHILSLQLLNRSDWVLVEQPSYPNALRALRQATARLVPVPVTGRGWDIEQMVETLARLRPALAYLIPDFHNPTGAMLPESGRERLVDAAERSSTVLLADETHAELNLDGKPLPRPMAAFGDNVISIGSLSKVFWGGLRVGWIRATPSLVARLALERSSVDMASPVIEQLAAAHILSRMPELLPGRLHELGRRRETLLAALGTHLPHWDWTRPAGGLSVWTRLDRPISTALAAAARQHGVSIPPGPRFSLDGMLERYLRIPFALPPGDLEEAIERLAKTERDLT